MTRFAHDLRRRVNSLVEPTLQQAADPLLLMRVREARLVGLPHVLDRVLEEAPQPLLVHPEQLLLAVKADEV